MTLRGKLPKFPPPPPPIAGHPCVQLKLSLYFFSLAEVYEKALNNVLNIQPNFKMDENHKTITPEKRPLATPDTPQLQPPGGCKQLYASHNDTQHRTSDEKKLNHANKSAFHVPEKRRLSNSQSRYGNWSHDHPFPYAVNYPGDYYPVIHPPPMYPRYDNLYLDRFNYYHGPRRREFPVFTHVLPWLQFERDYKPMTTSQNKSVTSPRFGELCPKGTVGYDARKNVKTDMTQNQLRLSNHVDKYAGHRKSENAGTEEQEDSRMRTDEKCSKSPDLYNVKTRSMRAVEKKHDLNTASSRKDSFGSPKEEFLFSLGLTRVDKYHVG